MKSTPLVFAGLVFAAVIGGIFVHAVDTRSRLAPLPPRAARPDVADSRKESASAQEIALSVPEVAPATAPSLDAPITAEEVAEVLADADFVARLPSVDGALTVTADATTSGTVLNDGTVLPASGGIVITADGKAVSAGSNGVSIMEDGRIVSLPAGGYTVARDGTITPRPATKERETN